MTQRSAAQLKYTGGVDSASASELLLALACLSQTLQSNQAGNAGMLDRLLKNIIQDLSGQVKLNPDMKSWTTICHAGDASWLRQLHVITF